MTERADIVIVGAGAAGLMASIHAARPARAVHTKRRIIALDGATTLGAKILVAGGGRCNVTHHNVTEQAFAGSSGKAIAKVLRRFDVPETVAFFRELGVPLKRETSGKLFPTTDKARTVLQALLHECNRLNVEMMFPMRVQSIERDVDGFILSVMRRKNEMVSVRATRVIMATGGKSLPKSGSDGFGYELVKRLGHCITPRLYPALVPLILADGHWLRKLSGVSLEVTLELRSSTNKRLRTFTNSMLLTHFGLSGPVVLDISRFWNEAHHTDPSAHLIIKWLPDETFDSIDQWLQLPNKSSIGKRLSERLPARLASALCESINIDSSKPSHTFSRDQRRALAKALVEMPLRIIGDRGFTHAEVTAGGVPLSEIQLKTMESRTCPELYICGEICDVDGRIGGFNFQWAWASGSVAGAAAATSISGDNDEPEPD